MGSGRKGRELDRSTDQGERPVATIVEYSAQKRAITEVPDGWFSVILDPAGAAVGLWQVKDGK